jgi:hypothetical protein
MLRVRPLIHTSDVPGAADFLRALGLTPAIGPVPDHSSAVFDAGGGRVALHSCRPGSAEDGRAALAFDVGDVREFARRTEESGTAAELCEEGHGLAARITAPDGMSFLAAAGPRETGAQPSRLSVLAVWHTPDIGPAARVLRDIGAKPRISSAAGTWHDFRAKNGGLVAARAAERMDVELAFEYDGDVRDLVGDLAVGGLEPVVTDGSYGRSLRIRAPWGADVRINGCLRHVDGYAVHQQG